MDFTKDLIELYSSDNPIIRDDIKLNNPFIDYVRSDKSKYPLAKDLKYIDIDDDFRMGDSGGFLMNIDFIFVNTDVFREVAIYYEHHNQYTSVEEGTTAYKKFWGRETKRRRNGMTANCKLYFKDVKEYFDPNTSDKRRSELLHPLRITGDHYNYLNYGRIQRYPLPSEIESRKAQGLSIKGKIPGFPRFSDGDYWNFKIDEFIYNNHFHLCKAKARRKGFSFKRGSQAANTVNLNPGVTVILLAYDIKYLTDSGATSDMVKTNLDWYESQTAWVRGFISEPVDEIELGYKYDGHKKGGFRSRCLSYATNRNESAAVGKDAVEIDMEEAGKFQNIQETHDITVSSLEQGAHQVGVIRWYGTGGTKDANWVSFSRAFYNPAKNDMMPFENVWDVNARENVCGFFFPQIWFYEPYVDSYGNSILSTSWFHDFNRKEEAKINKDYSDYLIFVGQRANSPEEAFINTIENIFSSEVLTKQIARVSHDPDYSRYVDGIIEPSTTKSGFDIVSNIKLKSENKPWHDYIMDVPHTAKTDITGCWRFYQRPILDAEGNVPDDLYFITYDTVKIDKDKKQVTVKNSLNAVHIWGLPNAKYPHISNRLIASFVGRHNTTPETDNEVLNAAKLYNAKVFAELNVGTFMQTVKLRGMMKYLMKDLSNIFNRTGNEVVDATYGKSMTSTKDIIESLIFLKNYLYTPVAVDSDGNTVYNLNYIYDLPLLLELNTYNLSKNFDRISSARLAPYILNYYNYKFEKQIKRNEEIKKNAHNHERIMDILNNY